MERIRFGKIWRVLVAVALLVVTVEAVSLAAEKAGINLWSWTSSSVHTGTKRDVLVCENIESATACRGEVIEMVWEAVVHDKEWRDRCSLEAKKDGEYMYVNRDFQGLNAKQMEEFHKAWKAVEQIVYE
ncbi:hypothetical protein STSP2_00970 [Anaerohalosphaera lusitana]|uniref:Uncharacterized protein n=1 Tax=Anaerohalosphaera lusitana TaxID=1936003 RepID=A0A1U9NJR5_9BACT|nr:hypothetical protein [Anaerohalosphaera lusitana]AQT67820.1 hypothetical protein STSP2_00970 [Anaerohalosphaera lusitana]